MASNNKKNKSSYQGKSTNINLGMIILAVILIYTCYSIVRYATAKHIVGYEVRTGSLSNNKVYEGVAVRNEIIAFAEHAGYINYYSKETDRLGCDRLACTIDPTGKIAEKMNSGMANSEVFTSEDYSEMKSDIVSFVSDFSPSTFRTLYSFKNSFDSSVQKITNRTFLDDINKLSQKSTIHMVNTEETGYIIYSVDGYEGKSPEDITVSDFDSVNYSDQKKDFLNNALVSVGDPIYKMSLDEDWSVVILLGNDKEAKTLDSLGILQVRFLKNQAKSWAKVSTRQDATGNWFATLSFTNSMMNFCTDRFVDVELITDEESGLKIPKSALIDDDFYVVPTDFVTPGTSTKVTVLRKTYTDKGEATSEVVTLTPYNKDDSGYYFDKSDLNAGDTLVAYDTSSTFTVSATAALTGVYNINKGYADFRQVSKLTENDEYAIVKSDSVYGLREYDHIVLDASTMSPNEFVYS